MNIWVELQLQLEQDCCPCPSLLAWKETDEGSDGWRCASSEPLRCGVLKCQKHRQLNQAVLFSWCCCIWMYFATRRDFFLCFLLLLFSFKLWCQFVTWKDIKGLLILILVSTLVLREHCVFPLSQYSLQHTLSTSLCIEMYYLLWMQITPSNNYPTHLTQLSSSVK